MCVKYYSGSDANYKGIYQFGGSERIYIPRRNISVCGPVLEVSAQTKK